ncbi:MAG: hypothetical protein QY331_14495 [Melioribacteraceae bacterium]|nr:MAG: hypothetical protein QY331_14495 [Melioribacteraceae bacterium]
MINSQLSKEQKRDIILQSGFLNIYREKLQEKLSELGTKTNKGKMPSVPFNLEEPDEFGYKRGSEFESFRNNLAIISIRDLVSIMENDFDEYLSIKQESISIEDYTKKKKFFNSQNIYHLLKDDIIICIEIHVEKVRMKIDSYFRPYILLAEAFKHDRLSIDFRASIDEAIYIDNQSKTSTKEIKSFNSTIETDVIEALKEGAELTSTLNGGKADLSKIARTYGKARSSFEEDLKKHNIKYDGKTKSFYDCKGEVIINCNTLKKDLQLEIN